MCKAPDTHESYKDGQGPCTALDSTGIWVCGEEFKMIQDVDTVISMLNFIEIDLSKVEVKILVQILSE